MSASCSARAHAGAIDDYSDEEFEAIVHMLMGARGYLSRRYSYSEAASSTCPITSISAYQKLITRGLFSPPARTSTMNIETPRKKLDLSSAMPKAISAVLLMVLVHMTGDARWLEPPYRPKRDVRLIPDPEAGVPKEIQDEIRAAVLEAVRRRRTRSPSITDPGDELMLRMMRAASARTSRRNMRR